jgi:hypothetical protein
MEIKFHHWKRRLALHQPTLTNSLPSTKMRPSVAFLSLLAFIPALVDAAMCAAWFDPEGLDGVHKCCTIISGYWDLLSDKQAACLFPNEDIDHWKACASPLMSIKPHLLHAWQCSPCGDVCTVTGGPTITAPATKTPGPSASSSPLPPPTMYGPRDTVQPV